MSESLTHLKPQEFIDNSGEKEKIQSEIQEKEFTSLLNSVENLSPQETKILLENVINPEDLKTFQETNSIRVIEMLKNTSKIEENSNKNFDYFDINKNEISEIQNELDSLGLDINLLLEGYSKYIEIKLTGLTEKQKEKIKLSIKSKVLNLGGEIKELKSDLEPGEDFKNNRWIVNSKLQEKFSEINNKILPSAEILSNFNLGDKNSKRENGLYSLDDKIVEIQKMFEAEVLDNGDFDKTWKSGEIIDANTNNWNIVDSEDRMDSRLLKEKGIKKIEGVSLLNEKDRKIEEEAMLYFMTMIGVQIGVETIGGIPGTLVGGGVDLYDTFSKDEVLLQMLQGLNLVPDNYKMDKTILDNILAGVGIVPGMTQIIKGSKLANFMKKVDKKAFENAKNEIKAKLGIDDKIEQIVKFSKEELKRINIGETELGRKLDNNEKKAIIEAHNTGERGEDLKYSLGDLKQKVIVLQKAGFNNSEIKVLFDKNICGTEFPKFKTLYEDPRYDFLEKYRDILGEKLSEKDIIGNDGKNAIILKSPINSNEVIKIPRGEDKDSLIQEYNNHNKFYNAFVEGKDKLIIDDSIRMPYIEIGNNDSYLIMEKIEGQNLNTKSLLKFYKKEFDDYTNKNDINLDSLSDNEVKTILTEDYNIIEKNIIDGQIYYSLDMLKDILGTSKSHFDKHGHKGGTKFDVAEKYIIKEHKIIHEDLHPGNIMIDSEGNIYLIDFGRIDYLN